MTLKEYLEYAAYLVAILGGLGTAITALVSLIWWASSLFHEMKAIRETSAVSIAGIKEELAGIHTATKEVFSAISETLKEHDAKISHLTERVSKVEARF